MESKPQTLPEKPTLTDFLRANTRFIIDPIVTFLARYRFSPDALSVIGFLAHFGFAYLIIIGQFRWASLAIFFIAPLDAFDGALARKLGHKQNGFGAFLDSTLDRIAEIALFGGFIYYFASVGDDLMVALAYVAITGSVMVSYARSRAEALGLSCKVGIFSRVERYFVITLFLFLNLPNVAMIILAIGTWITVGQRMYHVWRQSLAND